ncbi:hypothetical protein HD806DRAFT_535005 [Xylariaceae sp. AK1471]|nr:hypothetical protein HD806DRAFT_535005 [Xylariaceae sp. AK1471]
MGFPTGNFGTDLAIAIGVAGASTIALLILVCTLAHCGPRLCGLSRKERCEAGVRGDSRYRTIGYEIEAVNDLLNGHALSADEADIDDIGSHQGTVNQRTVDVKTHGLSASGSNSIYHPFVVLRPNGKEHG